jgi:hypothetical protein
LTVLAKATIEHVGTTLSVTNTALAWGDTTLVHPYGVSFVAKAVSELTPLTFTWYEANATEDAYTAQVTGGIYNIATDGAGTQSVLTITPTNLDKNGFHYKCVVTDAATGTLSSTGTQPADGDTVVVGGITYTFKTVLGATAGNVLIGATVAATLSNLAACISGGTGGGSLYVATAVTPNVSVSVVATGDTTVEVAARTGMTAVALTAASAGVAQVDWSQAAIPNSVTSDIVNLTVL